MTSMHSSVTETCFVKFATACTVCPRLAFLPTNSSSRSFPPSTTLRHATHPAFGNTKRAPFPYPFSSMTSVYNMSAREHAEHLLAALHTQYEVTTNWTGSTYLGITLKWDYINRTCDLSTPGYIAAALHRFQHPLPN